MIDYDAIPGLLASGLTARQIAEHFQTTKGSLAVQCSKRGISLRGPNSRRGGPRKPRVAIADKPLDLKIETVEQLRDRAAQMKIHPSTLVRRLIEAIVEDDLFKAVLDVEEA